MQCPGDHYGCGGGGGGEGGHTMILLCIIIIIWLLYIHNEGSMDGPEDNRDDPKVQMISRPPHRMCPTSGTNP